jgi:hypothetical protein
VPARDTVRTRSTSGDAALAHGTSARSRCASRAVRPEVDGADPIPAATRLRMTRLSSPIDSTCASASRRAPSLTDIMAITAATPSTTPSTLSDVRSL